MAKEPDQTRWVGIRPTDPSENIPVTESSPLTSIEVEPTPGSANFPVTESAPLTQIKVEPLAGCAYQNVNTRKLTPAISDLQAISGFVRMTAQSLNVGAPTYDHDIYTVPADKIFIQQLILVYSGQADPTFVGFILRSGGIDYNWLNTNYGAAWSNIRSIFHIMYNEGETVRVHWSGTLAGTDVFANLLGYLIDKY